MALLPKTTKEFAKAEYWNKFFKSRGENAFEWYGEYLQLSEILHKYISTKNRILNVGCGNSKLSGDLYDVGIEKIVNIDVSPVVIKQMKSANETRSKMQWLQMDALNMTFETDSFNVVLDKGTLDALFCDGSDEVVSKVTQYLNEVDRVLSSGGRYIIVSLLQKHILELITTDLPKRNYILRIVRCFEAEQKNEDGIPVFVVVATKFRLLPTPIFEICLSGSQSQTKRLKSAEEMADMIESIQRSAVLTNKLSNDLSVAVDEIEMELFVPGVETPRYRINVVDCEKPLRENGSFACFIVPQGREVEWLFATKSGRKKLLTQTNHNRLAIVSTTRDHSYPDWKEVQKELSPSILSLAPKELKRAKTKTKFPFLSLGDELGQREIICKGSSDISGAYIVEDITIEDGIYRRLFFANTQSTIQSEAAVKLVYAADGTVMQKSIDKTYLSCQHHLYMSIGLHSIKSKNALLIGLGGGALCSFIETVQDVQLTVVEIDPAILQVAIEFFNLSQSKGIHVQIDDGMNYLKSSSCKRFDAVMFDVDSKDPSSGISCPPEGFLEDTILERVKVLMGNSGIFILNFVCRDIVLRNQVLSKLKRIFKTVCAFKLEEDLNEIVYCRNVPTKWQKKLEAAAKDINKAINSIRKAESDLVDVDQFINKMTIESF